MQGRFFCFYQQLTSLGLGYWVGRFEQAWVGMGSCEVHAEAVAADLAFTVL